MFMIRKITDFKVFTINKVLGREPPAAAPTSIPESSSFNKIIHPENIFHTIRLNKILIFI